ncbi:MAG TPA: energy transducer TonB, partial [Alistipes sp.]|nr:energy transducer TonB [Alistipes sp.]
GPVTVRLDVKDPVRKGSVLEIPAYMCEGGGEVVVEIVVNRAGDITSARVRSGGDAPMREAALRAARSSRVNIDPEAPARQTGTITYVFIPQ